MSFGDLFKGKQNQMLQDRVSELEAKIPQSITELENILSDLKEKQNNLEQQIVEKEEHIKKIDAEILSKESRKKALISEMTAIQTSLISLNDEVLYQSFALYEPRYKFASSAQYKDKLIALRADQKQMLKEANAAAKESKWVINGSNSEGKKMVRDVQKLLLRAFNSECDELIEKVKFNNVDASVKRITASNDAINKLGQVLGIFIPPPYFQSKINELYIAHEYQLKLQEEKEEQKRIREEMREQAKLEKELEEARKNIEKEQKHYQNALTTLNSQLKDPKLSQEQKDALLEKKAEIESQIGSLDDALQKVDYRAANQKAGYVYVISNVGSFGEGIYKIGMTRRLEPMERVDELGDASVPFDFDVHAMIFSEDAPALEAALHKAFEDKKVNMINYRREFFKVSLDEIKEVVRRNYDKTVEFNEIPLAEEFRQSSKIKEYAAKK